MDTYTLEKILSIVAQKYRKNHRENIKIGVFSCDQLKNLRKNDKRAVALIVNTDSSENAGIHWQAIWIPPQELKEERKCYFFDSYGRPPMNDEIRKFITNNTDITIWYNQQLQGFDSICCGEWCCVFLSCVSDGCSTERFCRQFSSSNFTKNDHKILGMYNTIFFVKNSKMKTRQICCKYSQSTE